MKSAVIILHYKDSVSTAECFNSVKQSEGFDVIIVSNSGPLNKRPFGKYSLIENNTNKGFSGGVNVGLRHAFSVGYDNFIILNNDTTVPKGSIEGILNFMADTEGIGAVSPKIHFAPGYEFHKNRYRKDQQGKVIWYAGGVIDWKNIHGRHRGVDEIDEGDYSDISPTDFATGCMMGITRKAIEKIGFFDEKYFLYYEDADYSMRLKKRGMKVMYFGKVSIFHKNAQTSGKPGSEEHVYYQTRNRFYFGFRHAPLRSKKSLTGEIFRMYNRGGTYRRAAVDFITGRMGGRP